MNCQQVQKSFSNYMDGTLNSTRTDQIREHLASCDACRSEWQVYQSLLQGLHNLPPVEPSESFDQKLQQRLREQSLTQRPMWWFLEFPSRWVIPSLVGVLLILSFGGYLYLKSGMEMPPGTVIHVNREQPPSEESARIQPLPRLLSQESPLSTEYAPSGGRLFPSTATDPSRAEQTNYVLYTVSYDDASGLLGF